MTADHIGIAMAMGFFSMLVYVEGLRPLLMKGFRELRIRWSQHINKEHTAMINPHKPKYHPLYWTMVQAAADESEATRHKVGAIVVTPTGMISVGWNGMPSGMDNCCESTLVWDEVAPGVIQQRPKTNPEVIHAERNAIDKMTRQGVPTQGSILFVSRAPCFECAKAIHGLGLAGIFYQEDHDDMRGVELLKKTGNFVCRRDKIISLQEASGLSVL